MPIELARKPITERDHWEVIESLGGSTWRMNHDLADGRINDPDGTVAKAIHEQFDFLRSFVAETCEKFGIILPEDTPKANLGAEPPSPPEGKRYYWEWYKGQKSKFLRDQYNQLICSACPLSGGFEEFDSRIPCEPFNGMLYRLESPFHCAMISPRLFQVWTPRELSKHIIEKGGEEALSLFVRKALTLYRLQKEGELTIQG